MGFVEGLWNHITNTHYETHVTKSLYEHITRHLRSRDLWFNRSVSTQNHWRWWGGWYLRGVPAEEREVDILKVVEFLSRRVFEKSTNLRQYRIRVFRNKKQPRDPLTIVVPHVTLSGRRNWLKYRSGYLFTRETGVWCFVYNSRTTI